MQTKLINESTMQRHFVDDKLRNLEYEIEHLRNLIRIDMRDYQLLCSDDNNGNFYFPGIKSGFKAKDSLFSWYNEYLFSEIQDNISKLKKLLEQNNE